MPFSGVWDNIAGISSILLSKENNALATRIHGAMNVKSFLECIRPFQDADFGSIKYPSQVRVSQQKSTIGNVYNGSHTKEEGRSKLLS